MMGRDDSSDRGMADEQRDVEGEAMGTTRLYPLKNITQAFLDDRKEGSARPTSQAKKRRPLEAGRMEEGRCNEIEAASQN